MTRESRRPSLCKSCPHFRMRPTPALSLPTRRPAGKKGQLNSDPLLRVGRAPTSLPVSGEERARNSLEEVSDRPPVRFLGEGAAGIRRSQTKVPSACGRGPGARPCAARQFRVRPPPARHPPAGHCPGFRASWLPPASDPLPSSHTRPRPILPSRLRLRFGLQHSANRQ